MCPALSLHDCEVRWPPDLQRLFKQGLPCTTSPIPEQQGLSGVPPCLAVSAGTLRTGDPPQGGGARAVGGEGSPRLVPGEARGSGQPCPPGSQPEGDPCCPPC